MHWVVAAPFTLDPISDRWLVPFVPPSRHRFTLVPAPRERSWHERRVRSSGWIEWARAWRQGYAAWGESRGGIITVFPELALAVGMRKRCALEEKPIVAWCFNLGALHGGTKRRVARTALARIDRFVVHSRAETLRYAEWLELPPERFVFVPLQRGRIAIEEREDIERPFVLAMGSARRDYATFFEAVRRTGHRTVVVAARHAVDGLAVPDNVEIRSALTPIDCRRLAQRARVNVVPVKNDETASGQVTLVEAMRMGRAVVATRCIGSEDYIEHERTGLVVEPGSVEDLAQSIERVWDDAVLRTRLARAAARFTAENCSDEAAGRALRSVLDDVVEKERAACAVPEC
jgi:glycosyltransferase involved in cell wall biosynthesis